MKNIYLFPLCVRFSSASHILVLIWIMRFMSGVTSQCTLDTPSRKPIKPNQFNETITFVSWADGKMDGLRRLSLSIVQRNVPPPLNALLRTTATGTTFTRSHRWSTAAIDDYLKSLKWSPILGGSKHSDNRDSFSKVILTALSSPGNTTDVVDKRAGKRDVVNCLILHIVCVYMFTYMR